MDASRDGMPSDVLVVEDDPIKTTRSSHWTTKT
jgi:hypothetical protein